MPEPQPSPAVPMRVTLITEGTYPFVIGGVSSWCHNLVTALDDIEWHVLPITASGLRRTSVFDIPSHVTLHRGIELWSRPSRLSRSQRLLRGDQTHLELPAKLCRLLLGPADRPDELIELLGSCRADPRWARTAFRSEHAWELFLDELRRTSSADGSDLYADITFTVLEASELWQTLYWLAQTASTPVPDSDVVMLTEAGWSAALAAAEKVERGTPVILAEHSLHAREAYLEAARSKLSLGRQFSRTRLARGLSRLCYAVADRVTPVSDAHHRWETRLGANPVKLETIVTGVTAPSEPPAMPENSVITSVGRVDPLKDVVTMLRTAARVLERHPNARFVHWGPVSEPNRPYYEMCLQVHEELGLGEGFRFMGGTSEPRAAMRSADIYLSTSISEGLPLSVLEAMTEARPVVATDVGGCADAITGCGVLANAGDHLGLAHAIGMLLDDPDLARLMGRRGYRRARRRYDAGEQAEQYRSLLSKVAG